MVIIETLGAFKHIQYMFWLKLALIRVTTYYRKFFFDLKTYRKSPNTTIMVAQY